MVLYTDKAYNFNTASENADTYLHGCYFHGKIQELLGYDLICVPSSFIPISGIYPFEVIDRKLNKQICTGRIYMWNSSNGYMVNRGLAVMNDDAEGHDYALKCFMEKRKSL